VVAQPVVFRVALSSTELVRERCERSNNEVSSEWQQLQHFVMYTLRDKF
jgi:hypothetical protein